jgi:hypothetical protein
MKKINEIDRALIRAKLSGAAGYDVGTIYQECFLSPEFGAFRAHIEFAFRDKVFILKVQDELTDLCIEKKTVFPAVYVGFVNKEHRSFAEPFGLN